VLSVRCRDCQDVVIFGVCLCAVLSRCKPAVKVICHLSTRTRVKSAYTRSEGLLTVYSRPAGVANITCTCVVYVLAVGVGLALLPGALPLAVVVSVF
jgi:hypothetical protein